MYSWAPTVPVSRPAIEYDPVAVGDQSELTQCVVLPVAFVLAVGVVALDRLGGGRFEVFGAEHAGVAGQVVLGPVELLGADGGDPVEGVEAADHDVGVLRRQRPGADRWREDRPGRFQRHPEWADLGCECGGGADPPCGFPGGQVQGGGEQGRGGALGEPVRHLLGVAHGDEVLVDLPELVAQRLEPADELHDRRRLITQPTRGGCGDLGQGVDRGLEPGQRIDQLGVELQLPGWCRDGLIHAPILCERAFDSNGAG